MKITNALVAVLCLSSSLSAHVYADSESLETELTTALEVAPWRYDALQVWNGEFAMGREQSKGVLQWDLEQEDGDISASEWGVFYRYLLPNDWELDTGLQKDFKATPSRNWLVTSVSGNIFLYLNSSFSVMFSNDGRWGSTLSFDYGYWISSSWTVTPSLELNYFNKEDASNEIGAGLSSLNGSVVLAYEDSDPIKPYLSVNHNQNYGDTAKLLRENDDPSSETLWIIGMEIVFP